jgi:Lrp/AsnC family transcriptional regulator for asnA, asnC and gidA
MAQIADIDELDVKILATLLENARMPYTDVANLVHTSSGTIHVRMKKLEALGVVEGAQLLINPTKMGFDVCAFLGIYLQKGSLYKVVIEELRAIPEIVEAHYITGSYSILAKILCRDTQHLRHVLNERIQAIEGIERTETFISLEASITRPLHVEEVKQRL